MGWEVRDGWEVRVGMGELWQMRPFPFPRGLPLTPGTLLSPRVFSSEQKGVDWGWGSAGKGSSAPGCGTSQERSPALDHP